MRRNTKTQLQNHLITNLKMDVTLNDQQYKKIGQYSNEKKQNTIKSLNYLSKRKYFWALGINA